ncbi:MAG: transporter substrate-binding domain-containing protein [Proteobacteria bacterium]|nr:transporter substrate-binding domain-containing protein [Pseudomonadota bacterium]
MRTGYILLIVGVIFQSIFLNTNAVNSHESYPILLSEQVENFKDIRETIPASLLNKTLSIGVYEGAPFAFQDEKTKTYKGISIDLWEMIARKNGLSFTYVPVTFEQGLKGISEEKYDLLLGNISDFPRKAGMKFQYTIPFYVAGIGIAYLKESSFRILSDYLISWDFLIVSLILLACLFFQAGSFWIFEHKKNPDYKKSFWRAIGSGLWWSTGIMTNANIDEGETKTFFGRIVAAFWIFGSLLAMNILIASATSVLTVGKMSFEIGDIEDLKRSKNIFCVEGTFGQHYLNDHFIPYKGIASLDTGLKALENRTASVLIYSYPALRYGLLKRQLSDIDLIPSKLGIRYYGMVVHDPSPLLRIINRDILALINTEEMGILEKKYLGERKI